jgi:hypothetical protein
MNPSMLFMSFSPSHRLETTMPTVGRALIFTRWRVVFPSYQKLSSLLGVFLTFLLKIKDGNSMDLSNW